MKSDRGDALCSDCASFKKSGDQRIWGLINIFRYLVMKNGDDYISKIAQTGIYLSVLSYKYLNEYAGRKSIKKTSL